MKTVHISDTNGVKSIQMDELGKIISIRAFKKDISKNRLKSWRKVNKEVVRYCDSNMQEFGEFLLKSEKSIEKC